ncbi:MAG: prolipoprotein diacylglyceryl transferase [Thermoanaerobaculia bacterium]|nr:prolipoprotein diacylglyceryl transferase [Thermoanaerobaculia bacterium]
MIREVFSIGPFPITPFGIMMMLAFFGAFAQLRANLRRAGIGGEEDASALFLAAALGGVIGGKIYYSILYGDPMLLLARSGLVYYGGFLLGTAAVWWTARRRGMPLWRTADAVLPSVAIGYALGRVGCFLVGDDYGVPTDGWWGVAFPVGLPPTEARYLRSEFGLAIPADIPADELLKVHPTQLYETTLALLIWGAGLALLGRSLRPGTTALAVAAMLAAERFAVEFLRAKDDRLLGTFTVAQAISAGVLVAIAWLWSRRPAAAEP